MRGGPFDAVPADQLPGASLLSQCMEMFALEMARGLVPQEAVAPFIADAVKSAAGGGEGRREVGLLLQAELKKNNNLEFLGESCSVAF